MKPTASKNRDLIDQYPFISIIMRAHIEPYGGVDERQVDDLTIKVQKADGDLMWRQADNIGLEDHSFSFSTAGNRKGQVARRGECIFAISHDNLIINRVDWPRNDDERRKNRGEIYAWSVFYTSKMRNASNNGYLHANSIVDKMKYMVWVSIEAWHKGSGNHGGVEIGARFGKLTERSMEITIYSEPDEGFDKLHENSPLMNHLYLSSNVIMRAISTQNHDILAIDGRIAELCTLFQDEVYFNGMKDILDNSRCRGASGQFGPVKVLCAGMCGYDRVMLEDPNCWVTYQLRPGAKSMYVLGMGGTLPNIRRITKTVVEAWGGDSKNREVFKPDKKVSVI